MTQHKQRPVFQSAEETEKVGIDPPLKMPDEDLGDLIGDETPKPVIEQKELNGWKVIGPEQQAGKHYLVTHDIKEDGIQAYWRKTRILDHFRWTLKGRWSQSLTNNDLVPQPIYFKE